VPSALITRPVGAAHAGAGQVCPGNSAKTRGVSLRIGEGKTISNTNGVIEIVLGMTDCASRWTSTRTTSLVTAPALFVITTLSIAAVQPRQNWRWYRLRSSVREYRCRFLRQTKDNGSVPPAVTLKTDVVSDKTVWACGCVVMEGPTTFSLPNVTSKLSEYVIKAAIRIKPNARSQRRHRYISLQPDYHSHRNWLCPRELALINLEAVSIRRRPRLCGAVIRLTFFTNDPSAPGDRDRYQHCRCVDLSAGERPLSPGGISAGPAEIGGAIRVDWSIGRPFSPLVLQQSEASAEPVSQRADRRAVASR